MLRHGRHSKGRPCSLWRRDWSLRLLCPNCRLLPLPLLRLLLLMLLLWLWLRLRLRLGLVVASSVHVQMAYSLFFFTTIISATPALVATIAATTVGIAPTLATTYTPPLPLTLSLALAVALTVTLTRPLAPTRARTLAWYWGRRRRSCRHVHHGQGGLTYRVDDARDCGQEGVRRRGECC